MRDTKSRMAKARTQAGLSQQQMADMLKMQRTCYQRYEHGAQVPNANTAVRIARALNTTVEELFG